MKKFVVSMMMLVSLCLVLMVPAFAHNTTTNDTTMDTRTGIGTLGTNGVGINGTLGTNGTNGTYGTNGTIAPFTTNGTYDATRMNAYRTNTNVPRTTNYRAAATTNRNNFGWGWLGLLGLFGLAGMRSKSRDEIR